MATWRAPLVGTTILVAIDDTDNLDSPGTGILAQRLIQCMHAESIATAFGAVRHQLWRNEQVPYTTHNSNAVIHCALADGRSIGDLKELATQFLLEHSAPGSDPGLAICDLADYQNHDELVAYGNATKTSLRTQEEAYELAARSNIALAGLGGTNDGVIGALAGIGLSASGNDGMFLWMDELRNTPAGQLSYAELVKLRDWAEVVALDGSVPEENEIISYSDWVRPVLRDFGAVLLLDKDGDRWVTAHRSIVRKF